MELFDDISRKDRGSANYSKSRFDYLNRSARPESERVRNLLEEWFAHIPSEVQLKLWSDFRSKDDRQHTSAFFELYLHELLFRLKFDIDFHPTIEGESTHPDFMVSKSGEQLFYLEAALTGLSNTEVATKARENRVYDSLNKMKSPNFFIGLRVRGAPATSPPDKKIRDSLESRLADLDPDEVAEQLKRGNLEALPSWDLEYEGWRITFIAIPKSPADRGKPGVRPIGVQIPEVIFHTPHIGIRDSIRSKASKYGELDLPYVVAINIIDEFDVDDIDISNALFGEERVTVVFDKNDSTKQHLGRKPNGAWYGPNGPHNQRVSAVLIAVNLRPWSIAKVTPILWHNPWAIYPLSQDVLSLPQLVPDSVDNQLVKRGGKSSWQLLELYPNWPKTCKDI
jgi:hypothetical protein